MILDDIISHILSDTASNLKERKQIFVNINSKKILKKVLTKELRYDNIHIVARLVGQGVKTSPSHGENRSSILLQAASSRCGSVW